MKELALQLMNGEMLFKEMNGGTLENPRDHIKIADFTEPCEGTDLIAVSVAENKDIAWRDAYGESHIQHVFDGQTLAVDPRFIDMQRIKEPKEKADDFDMER